MAWTIVLAIHMIGLSMSLLALSPLAEPTHVVETMKNYDLDKLVSANQQPRIDNRTFRPSFDEQFDFKEQSRVEKAINDLCKNWTDELWFELVSRSDDGSYCIATHRPSAPGAKNWTVGDVCEEIAYTQLTRILDEVKVMLSTDDITRGRRPYAFSFLEGQSLKEWVELHSFKRFDEALSQIVDSALSQIAIDEKLSSDKRQEAVETLKREQATMILVENGLSRVGFPWEKYPLITKKSSR